MEAETAKPTNLLLATLSDSTIRLLDQLCMVAWGMVVLIGAMQALGIGAGPVTSYGGDVFGPIALWWTLRRTLFAALRFGAEIAAFTVWAGCCSWEICQQFDFSGTALSITEGIFDLFDLIAFTVTLFGCYLLDKMLSFRHRTEVESKSHMSNAA